MFSAAAVAFLVAALLILLVFRLAFGRRLRMAGGRTRQPRLGIVDAFDVDRQRQLVIVRRDNTEHLIMIGGPNDLLIEAAIVRAEAAREPLRRDVEPKLTPTGETTATALSLEDAIGAALAAPATAPSLPPAPGPVPSPAAASAAPRAPVLPLPTRRIPPGPAPLPARQSPSGPAPVVSSAPPPAGGSAPPIAVSPPAVGLRRPTPTLGGAPSSDPPATPRPPLLRVPPLRPAPRATPVAPPPPPVSGGDVVPPPAAPAPPPEPASSAPPVAVSEAKPDTPPQAAPVDTFESLEEEMAKLLGRGGPGGA